MKKRDMSVAAVAAIALIALGVAPADATEGSTADPIAALENVAPESLEDAADLRISESSGLEGTIEDVSIHVPIFPAEGITLSGDDDAVVVGIGLPNADQASVAVIEGAGTVSYDNGDGSTTVPVVKDDGSVQINTVIGNPAAPTRYEYDLDLPDGATVREIGPGMFAVIDAEGEPLTIVLPPWAKDAAGDDVPTNYALESGALVQYVEHNRPGVSYPVVADPKFAWEGVLPTIKTTRTETSLLRGLALGASGVKTYCTNIGAKVGLAIGVLCALNSFSISYNASWIYNAGKCSQLLIGPGVIGSVAYKDSYCK